MFVLCSNPKLLRRRALGHRARDRVILLLARSLPSLHRHFPVSGKLVKGYKIDGALFTVNPLAINQNVNVYTENKREVFFIESPDFGTVCLVAVGATCVGSITTTVAAPADVTKGSVHGWFSFGGSTVMAFFQPGAIEFDQDLIANTRRPLETLVSVNTRIGKALKGAAPAAAAAGAAAPAAGVAAAPAAAPAAAAAAAAPAAASTSAAAAAASKAK